MRILMWFAIGFAMACAFCGYCYVPWILSAAFLTAAIGISLLYLARHLRPARIFAVIMVGISAGLMIFHLYDTIYLSPLRQMEGKTEYTTLIVRDFSYETDHGCAVDATVEREGKHYRVRVYLNENVALKPGNRLTGYFRFSFTADPAKEELHYHGGQGIAMTASQRGNFAVERCWSTPWRDYPALWRHDFQETIDSAFPKDTAGFAKALLLGDRTDLSYETETDFKISGISHIIAVSGLHVSILFGFLHVISGRHRIVTAALGVPLVLLFAAITGFSPSVTRAALMQILLMLSLLADREYDPPTALGASALISLLVNPLVITSVSFQLSYSCMAGIFLFSEPIRLWLLDPNRLGRWEYGFVQTAASGISVSVAASVLTTPLVAVHFGAVSLLATLTNLMTLWVISFVFYGILGVCALSAVAPAVGTILAAVTAWPIRYVLEAAELVASIPVAAVFTSSGYIVAWLVFAYILLGLFLTLEEKPAGLFAGLVAGTLCLAVGLSWIEPMTEDYRMTVLDVGQGQAVLLQSDGKTFLVDCGGDNDEVAADVTAEYLLSQGIRRLDGIIVTHFDGDHTGGLAYLLSRIDTDSIFVPHCVDEKGVEKNLSAKTNAPIYHIGEDQNIRFGSTVLTIYAPVSYNSGNESSMCVLFQRENCGIMIMGDRGEAAERLLLKYHTLPDVDALVVGHHGSKSSTSEALLAAISPEFAFISVSEDNSYGHPHPTVLQRLEEYGCTVYCTDENGTIIFRG